MTRATRFGKPLPDDGCVGIVGTSTTWYNRSELLRAVSAWEQRGYRVKLGAHIWDRDDYQAGHPKDRAADMNAMYADPEVDLVHAFQGGYTAAQMLPHLDYDLIAANPKALVGFSDITALHTALLEHSGLATFYGPGAAGLGDPERGEWSKERLLKVLKDGGVGPVPPNPDDPYVRAIRGGRATAPLVGGCLWLLQHAVGTPWAPNLDDLPRGAPRSPAAGRAPRPDRRRRRRRAVQVRLARGPTGMGARPVDRRRPRAVPRAARGPRAIQAPSRAREAPGHRSAGGHGDPRRGRRNLDDRRTGGRPRCVRLGREHRVAPARAAREPYGEGPREGRRR
jgi:hypothetical protein